MQDRKLSYSLFLSIITFTIYRIYFLYNNNYALYADEAQYWEWSRNLAFGYYSKPPFIAWIIRLSTSIFGNSEAHIRLFAPILHGFTSLIIYLITIEYSNQKTAFYSSIIYLTLPAVSLSSSIMSTDVLLLFFWSLTLLFFIKSLKNNNIIFWILTGISLGFGIVTKYNMTIFILSSLVYLLISRRFTEIIDNYKFWIGLFFAIILYIPNFIWNYNNNFVSYIHTKEISKFGIDFHPKQFIEFISAQIIIISPVIFIIFVKSFFDYKKIIRQNIYRLALSYYLPILSIMIYLSITSKALGNWSAPSVITIIIWSVYFQINEKRKATILNISILINMMINMLFYNYHDIFTSDKNNSKIYVAIDPFYRLYGWREIAGEIKSISKSYPNIPILISDRKFLVEMIYYCKDMGIEFYKFNPYRSINNHYDLTRDINNMKYSNFIYITNLDRNDAANYFSKSIFLENIKIEAIAKKNNSYNIYYLENFLGY